MTDEQVNFGIEAVEVPGDTLVIFSGWRLGDVGRDGRGGVDDLGPAPVIDAELQGQTGIARRKLLGVLQFADDAVP